jgi:hypothetical protein
MHGAEGRTDLADEKKIKAADRKDRRRGNGMVEMAGRLQRAIGGPCRTGYAI